MPTIATMSPPAPRRSSRPRKRAPDPEKARLRARVAALEADAQSRSALGVAPKPPVSPDGELIAAVCTKLNIRRVRLAEMLGVDPAILSRANAADPSKRIPLAEHHFAALRALLRGGNAARKAATQGG
jgi:hypothetical protein